MVGDKELAKAFDNFARQYDTITAFSDALEMLVCEFCPHWKDPETGRLVGLYTENYLEVVKRYPADHIREYYPPICKALFMAYNEGVTPEGGWCDPLGEYFQEIASSRDKSWKGQFFTPLSICELSAKMVNFDKERRNQNVADPACGSGRMLIAYDRTCPPDAMNFYVGTDIDARCIRIAAINFFFHGMRGVLICGNTLSMEARFGYRVYLPETGLGIKRLGAEECKRYLVVQKQSTKDSPKSDDKPHPGLQLTLF